MGFDEIAGSVSHRLREELASSRAVHAYLLTGPAGTGKRTLADICARALFCQSDGVKPCDVCPACRQMLTGNHPDLIRIVPEKSTIKIDWIRDTIRKIAIKPIEAKGHVIIIEQADKMRPEAQNALLKTLEEPPGSDVFFLTTTNLRAMLPTIISRCRVVRVNPLSQDMARDVLIQKGIAPGRAAMLARLCQGSVGEALRRNEDGAWFAQRDRVLVSLSMLHDRQDVALAAMPLCEKKEQSEDVLNIMELIARDKMALQCGASPMQPDIEDKLSALPMNGSAMLQGIYRARQMTASNVGWQATLEMMLLDFVNTQSGGK